MINAMELRIGNIIGWRTGFGEFITGSVYEVHKDRVAIGPETVIDANSSGQGFMKIEGIEPVPLTAEWLQKMGFIWDKEEKVFSIQVGNTLYIDLDQDFDCAITPETWRGSAVTIWADIKYVHQLQNLYWCLTGEELKLKYQ